MVGGLVGERGVVASALDHGDKVLILPPSGRALSLALTIDGGADPA